MIKDDPVLCQPDYRATLSDGRLILVGWEPWMLARCGPSNRLLVGEHTEPTADLFVHASSEDREVIVAERARCGDPRLRDAVVRWAALLGYRRIWFSDDVVTLDGTAPGAGRLAETTCRTCNSTWADDTPEFWLGAHHWGVFPMRCPLCGNAMPQWSVTEEDARPVKPATTAPSRLGDETDDTTRAAPATTARGSKRANR